MNSLEKSVSEITLSVPWGHIAAKSYGPENAKKVLVVHGIMDNAGSFDRLLKLLPQEYHYVCIDLPGHGLSSPFNSGTPLHFFDYVYSLSLVLDALKWKTCIYLGHSFGAQIGLFFSILYPGKLEKLICIDGILPTPIDNIVSYIQSLYDLKSYNKSSETLYTKDDIIYALKFRRIEALTTDAAEAIFPRAVTKVDNLYKYNRDTRLRYTPRPIFNKQDYKEILVHFRTPILLIIANNSTRIKLMMEFKAILQLLAGNKCELNTAIVVGNHDIHNNYPERVAPHVCKFLGDDLKSKL